jgi:uncharacterized membrane protein
MTHADPELAAYFAALDDALSMLGPAERGAVLAEIHQHVADAIHANTPVADIVRSLGPVDAMARAYELELLVNPRTDVSGRPSQRAVRVVALLAVGSVTTLVVMTGLGALAMMLSLSGLGLVLAGAAETSDALPAWFAGDVEPWVAIVVGVVMVVAGIVAGAATVGYVKHAIDVMRRVIPTAASPD